MWLLQLSFPVEEGLLEGGFADADGVAEAFARFDAVCPPARPGLPPFAHPLQAVGLAASLRALFDRAGSDPVATAEPKAAGPESLPPELRQMLEKAMAKQKGGAGVDEARDGAQEAGKAAWAAGEGKVGAVLGPTVWEALAHRRASFQHVVVRTHVQRLEEGDASAVVPVDLLDQAVVYFHQMLRAQGPIASDAEEPEAWVPERKPIDDNTQYLFRHGIYSSQHLIALKMQAELLYWRWKHCPGAPRHGDWRVLAATTHAKFVHVIDQYMQGTGWKCEVERGRLAELRAA